MYLPSSFCVDDPELAWSVVDEYPFGILVEPAEPSAVHVPFLIGDRAGASGRLRGHVARANGVSEQLEGRRVLAVFTGPHGYVSPTWYEHPTEHVPTWNYVIAHAAGTAKLLPRAASLKLLEDLCRRFEGPDGFRPSWLEPAVLDGMLDQIVAFDIHVEQITAKFKLSQNRSAADQGRVMESLAARGEPADLGMLEWMRRAGGVETLRPGHERK